MDVLEHVLAHLQGKVLILGIGNRLQSDDGAGSILAERLLEKSPYLVFDAGSSPENYLGKIIKERPDNIVIIDASDFGVKPGEFSALDGDGFKTTNLFSTHNASIALTISYLKSNLKADIIILLIQPKSTVFGDKISPEVTETISKLEKWFSNESAQEKG